MSIPRTLCVLAACLAWCGVATALDDEAKPDRPEGQHFKAADVVGSDSRVVEQDDAPDGAVTNGRAWQPLIIIPVSDLKDEEADRLTIHIRHTGGPLLIKGVVDGKQVDVSQIWKRPETFEWTRVGPFDREAFGTQIYIIRGGEGTTQPHISDVVIAPQQQPSAGMSSQIELPGDAQGTQHASRAPDAYRPDEATLPPERPDDQAPALHVAVNIDWDTTVATVAPEMFGINDYETHDVAKAADPGYNAFLAELASPVIRIHRGNFPAQYLAEDGRSLDVEKIKAIWASATGYGDSKVMMNLAYWPVHMEDPETRLFRLEYLQEYVDLALELQRVMHEAGRPVEYWEVLNEKEGRYERAGQLDELWTIYNAVAVALKEADPDALVGGPGLTWAKPTWVRSFVKHGLEHSDFVTYHNYGTGHVTDTNEVLFSKLDAIEKHARFIRGEVDAAAKELGIERHIPIHLSEHNVKWVWTPFERRHANSVGACFHAGVLLRTAMAGIDGAQVWHLKGHAYGLIEADNTVRPTARLFKWGPRHLVGQLHEVQTDNRDAVELWAVSGEGGHRAVLVIAKAGQSLQLPPLAELIGDHSVVTAEQVNADGVTPLDLPAADEALTLPGYSLTLFSTR